MKVIERGKEVAKAKRGTGKEESKSETSSSFVMKRMRQKASGEETGDTGRALPAGKRQMHKG